MVSAFKTLERQQKAISPGNEFEYPETQKLTLPHIESFNSIWEAAGPKTPSLMDVAVSLLGKHAMFDRKPDSESQLGTKITFWVDNVRLTHPSLATRETKSSNRLMYPTECRQRSITYRGRLTGTVHYKVGDNPEIAEEKQFGLLPVMVRSNRCNLQNLGPADLIRLREEPEEMGGYFVINGNEKVIRLLIAQRRNHILAIQRPSYGSRGPGFTPYATQIRCVRRDQTSQTVTMHYLTTGNLLLRFALRKQEYMVPVSLLMRALVGASDREIFEAVVGGDAENIFVRDRVELLLRSSKEYAVFTKEQALSYLGDKFRVVMYAPEDMSNAEIGQLLLDRMVLVHLTSGRDKFNLLAHMVRKLYAVVSGECQEDNPDTQQMQEVYLPGHLYLALIKEKIDDFMLGVRAEISKDIRNGKVDFYNRRYVSRLFARVPADIGQKAQYFLATGNLISRTGLDMQQVSGYTIIAEKLNYLRYLSHFRCIHRGAFFAELKTTGVRKLLPEGWGFLCPVHTPDGSPCGLLNHLAHKCQITTVVEETDDVERTLVRLGVEPGMPRPAQRDAQLLTVQLDGRIVGYCSPQVGARVARALRMLKLQQKHGNGEGPNIPFNMEIGFVPPSHGGQLPGLFLFTTPARFVRPVTHLGLQKEDHVGSFEQVYMEIACLDEDVRPGITTHQELLPTHILSAVANLTPFCDFNQSPRNMYQCLSRDHDVLTRGGWKSIAGISEADEVMTMNLKTGAQEWSRVQKVAKVAHTGDMYRLQSDEIDVVCDASHRWYLNTKDAPASYSSFMVADMVAGGKLQPYMDNQWEHRGSFTVHANHAIPVVGVNRNEMYVWPECSSWLSSANADVNLIWCQFIGLVLGSGDLVEDSEGKQVVQIYSEADSAKQYVSLIQKKLALAIPEITVCGPVESSSKSGALVWTINGCPEMCRFFKPMIDGPLSFDPSDTRQCQEYDQAHYRSLVNQQSCEVVSSQQPRRWLHYDWLLKLSVEQARAVIAGLAAMNSEGSGSFEDGSVRVVTESVPLAHDLSILGLLASSKATAEIKHTTGSETASQNRRCWNIEFSLKTQTVALPQPQVYENPRHDGFIYCLQVANENFMARRQPNGHEESLSSGFFTGNCQMGKQTMGTPMQSYPYRTDNKLYRLQTGQTPICRPRIYDDYGVDNYPNGANAVVAVISYTGYDMEDAMILNKSAHERGFGYGSIYKTEYVDLGKYRKSGDPITTHFGVGRDMLGNEELMERIDIDGLPFPGIRVEDGLPLYAVMDDVRGRTKVHKYKGEAGYVETVRLLASANPEEELQVVALTFRIPRSPVIGDKFSSRHGQKGVCSQKFPAVDMPFTETGMQPDVIINPHAFPSRMTIGMFVESIAAKAGALHGVCQDATPFQFNETNTAADYFGEQLRKAGYNYHGNEPMYSGVAGTEMRADIYIGVVYYQRLRHMVNDKYQVRTTGPINPLTQQPVKGRKRGGGIRLGEMERDALIAHGSAYFLQDRLMNCSDYSLAYVCKCCGSMLAPVAIPATSHVVDLTNKHLDGQKSVAFAGLSSEEARKIMATANAAVGKGPMDLVCRLCQHADGITMVALPYVFRYLATELMSMNMKLRLDVK
ncbi:hypothetical protein IWW36_002569 [Coemansia brasiliensis]|uniref:DNA-directed RNA polymerase subunit beta n=1 Tax=Coemansia brasiliensis TaxID=2650707 RepID=A0A9W8M0I6_9FUNG|nr:hypothetical protein IWW36_002569 [Coemansia brasiliensis]